MKFRTESRIQHDGKTYDPGVVDLPREVGERLGLELVDGPPKVEREAHDKKAGK